MTRIGILGSIGSGKSYVAKNLGYPVFDADHEVATLYKKNKKIFLKLKKILPKNIKSFPIEKKEVTEAVLQKKGNLKKIIKIVHFEIRKKMNFFLKKNKNKKFVILDVPLLLENKLNKKNTFLRQNLRGVDNVPFFLPRTGINRTLQEVDLGSQLIKLSKKILSKKE